MRQAIATALLAASVCIFGPCTAWSQITSLPAAPPDLAEITVIAPRPPTPSEVAGDNIKSFVNSHSLPKDSGTGTLSRWKEAVCVKTEGLPAAFGNYVSARVEAIAAAVKTPQEKRNPCRPNVYVIFTNEPQTAIDMAVAQNPDLLGYHYSAQLKKLKTVDHPIQAWHVTGLQAAGGGVQLDSVWAAPLIVTWAGRISNGVHSFMLFTLVVVDGTKVLGYSLSAISDYIAMLTLSQVRLTDSCGELPSILDLMASRCTREKSQSITAADLAYLQALNTVGQEVDYFMQTVDIEAKMKKQLASR
jgi:membrane-associated protease RseP (regulator of RpoE activity)